MRMGCGILLRIPDFRERTRSSFVLTLPVPKSQLDKGDDDNR
jgi:hypothetical protein